MTESKREDKKTLINGHRAPNNEKNIISIKNVTRRRAWETLMAKFFRKLPNPVFPKLFPRRYKKKKRKKKSQNADY